MYVIGLFRELEKECPHLPSIRAFVNQLSGADQRLVLTYLAPEAVVMTWMGLTRDPLSPVGRRVYGPSVCSDTQWVWREDLRYFVEQYRVGLPEAFLEHVRSQQGQYRATAAERQAHFDLVTVTYNAARSGGDALRF